MSWQQTRKVKHGTGMLEVFGAPEWAGETGSTESKEAANVEDEGSLVLGPGGDEDGLVRSHVRDVPGVPSPCSGTYNG